MYLCLVRNNHGKTDDTKIVGKFYIYPSLFNIISCEDMIPPLWRHGPRKRLFPSLNRLFYILLITIDFAPSL